MEALTLVSTLVNDIDIQKFAWKPWLHPIADYSLPRTVARLTPNRIPRAANRYHQTMDIPAKFQKCGIFSEKVGLG